MPLDVAYQILKPVEFEFINELQLLSQSPFWKSVIVVPNNVVFGKVDQVFALVFAERHFGVGEFDEEFLVVQLLNLVENMKFAKCPSPD